MASGSEACGLRIRSSELEMNRVSAEFLREEPTF